MAVEVEVTEKANRWIVSNASRTIVVHIVTCSFYAQEERQVCDEFQTNRFTETILIGRSARTREMEYRHQNYRQEILLGNFLIVYDHW